MACSTTVLIKRKRFWKKKPWAKWCLKVLMVLVWAFHTYCAKKKTHIISCTIAKQLKNLQHEQCSPFPKLMTLISWLLYSVTVVVIFTNELLLWAGSYWIKDIVQPVLSNSQTNDSYEVVLNEIETFCIVCILLFFLSWIKPIQLCQFPNEWLWMFISFEWFFLVNQTVCDRLCFVSLTVN